MAAVGTIDSVDEGADRSMVLWYPPKKNRRLRMSGPPMVAPGWFRFSGSRSRAVACRALSAALRPNQNAVP